MGHCSLHRHRTPNRNRFKLPAVEQHRPLERSAMAQEMSFRDVQVSSSEIGLREIGLKDLWQALKDGYADVGAKPSVVVAFLIVLYPLFALLWSVCFVHASRLTLAFPIVA